MLDAALDAALRAIAALLLREDNGLDDEGGGTEEAMRAHAAACGSLAGVLGTPKVAAVLDAFALNVGVPRDMAEPPAIALRSHVRLFAGALRNTGNF